MSAVAEFKRLHLSHIRPQDIATLSDPNITALSVPEVLVVSQAIDHHLLTLKHGILGSDVEPFMANLIATSLGPSGAAVFFRSPTTQELRLCRRLAQVADDDIVTQMQLLRMLDVFCKLCRIYQRASIETILDVNQEPMSAAPMQPAGSGNHLQLPPALEAVVDLSKDIQASTAALTEGSVFATSHFEGVIPASVIYELAQMYGLDSRSWFKRQSAMTLLPSGDETVMALRALLDRQRLHAQVQQQSAVGKKSAGPAVNPAPPVAAPASPTTASSPSAMIRPSTVVPVEFVTTAAVSEAFAPLNEKILKLFIKTFGATDPNDPTNELGLDLVDGHLMMTLPLKQFASVLQLPLPKALKLVRAALDGVPNPHTAATPAWNLGFSSAKRRMSTVPASGAAGGGATTLANVNWEDIDDMFDTGIIGGGGSNTTSASSFSPQAHHHHATSGYTAFAVHHGGVRRGNSLVASMNLTTPPSQHIQPPTASATHPSTAHLGLSMESLPVDFATVIQRGYLRYPEFELVIQHLGGQENPTFEKQREEQQAFVDSIVSSQGGAPRALSPGRRNPQRAPDSESEQLVMDEQALYLETQLFPVDAAAKKASSMASIGNAAPSVTSNPSIAAAATESSSAAVFNNATAVPQSGLESGAPLTVINNPAAVSILASKSHAPHHSSPGRKHAKANNQKGENSPTLRGWPIHTHNAERLAYNSYNGRDSQRLERSVVASSDRTVASFITGDAGNASVSAAGRQSNAAALATATSVVASGTSISSAATGGATSDNGSMGAAASSSKRNLNTAANAVHRALMQVLDLQHMQRVLAAIPEEPAHLLQVGSHTSYGSVGAANGNHGGNGSSSGAGALSFLATSSAAPATMSMLTADFEEMDVSARRLPPGARSTTKTGSMARSYNGTRPPLMDDLSLVDNSCSANHHEPSVAGGLHASVSSLRTPRHQQGLVATMIVPANQNADSVTSPSAGDSFLVTHGSGDADHAAMACASQNTPRHLRSNSPKKTYGIHVQPWRSVHHIPKLRSEPIDTYCSSAKRSGGGFGDRGRSPSPPEKGTGSSTALVVRTAIQNPEVADGEKSTKEFAASLASEGAVEQTDTAAAPLSLALKPEAPPTKLVKQRPNVRDQRQKNGAVEKTRAALLPSIEAPRPIPPPPVAATDPTERVPTATARSSARAFDRRKGDSSAQRVPVANTARKPFDASNQLLEATLPIQARAAFDPSLEPQQQPASTVARRQKQAVAVRPTAASPRKSVVPGMMAVMDPSRAQHAGGSMLSFIPPALAADVLATLDLRFTYPPNAAGGSAPNALMGVNSSRPLALPPPMRNPLKLEPLAQPSDDPKHPVREPLHMEQMLRQKEEVSALRFR